MILCSAGFSLWVLVHARTNATGLKPVLRGGCNLCREMKTKWVSGCEWVRGWQDLEATKHGQGR